MLATAHSAVRSVLMATLTVLSAVVLGLATTVQSALTLAATTAVIVPGTGTPDPDNTTNYLDHSVEYYIAPSGNCVGGCDPVGVAYPASFWPLPMYGGLSADKWDVSVATGLTNLETALGQVPAENDIVIFGYSQGAEIASIEKGRMIEAGGVPDDTTFVLIANLDRPNGGLWARYAPTYVPFLDFTFNGPTPNSCGDGDEDCDINTYDIALQYDGLADFPVYPLNLLAVLNAVAGFQYVHGTYLAPKDDDPDTATPYGYTPEEVQEAVAAAAETCDATTHCQQHGDTRYITLPARTLPIMQPLLDAGTATGTSAVVVPIVDLISPATQTLIETGYDRTDYGEYRPAQLIPSVDPVKLATDLANDIPEGINAALNPGLDPLPGSVSTTDSSTEVTVAKSAEPPADKPLVRLSAIAKPGQGLTLAGITGDRATVRGPVGAAARPVKDLVNAIDGTVKKVDDTLKTAVKNVTGAATGATDKDDAGDE